jgi:hypothetical protein
MTLPVKWVSREEMLKSFVARFNDLKGFDTGLPDSAIPGHYKKIFNVFGFEPPKSQGAVNPIGDDAIPLISPKAGFAPIDGHPSHQVRCNRSRPVAPIL